MRGNGPAVTSCPTIIASDPLLASETESPVDALSDTRTLTAAIASGDSEAFARFFGAWFDWMRREAARTTGRDEAFCLDVVQDSMMRVIRSLKPMSTDDDLRRWLRVVVRSCAYDRLRREARAHRRERDTAGASTARHDADPEFDERLRWLERELQSIGNANARLLLMRYRFGWTLQQIGFALGLKPGAVDGRLRRLVSMLRRRAGDHRHE